MKGSLMLKIEILVQAPDITQKVFGKNHSSEDFHMFEVKTRIVLFVYLRLRQELKKSTYGEGM